MQASGLPEFLPFLCTSALWGQSCFIVHLASCIPPAPLWSLSGVAASTGWEPLFTSEITDGCDISCWLIWRRYFHFTVLPHGNKFNRIWETVHDHFCFGPTVLGGSFQVRWIFHWYTAPGVSFWIRPIDKQWKISWVLCLLTYCDPGDSSLLFFSHT